MYLHLADRDRAAGLALWDSRRVRADRAGAAGPNLCPREVTGIGAACR